MSRASRYLSAASFPPDLPTGPGAQPFINADPTLNALVQLGALRLNCDRAFLSLIDREYQFVVAEITRSHSIREMKYDGENERVFLGVSKLEACWGVCPTTMKAFVDETGEWIRQGPNVIANRTRYIVNDFRADPAYSERSYVTGYPFFVSYLEVPLISPLGYVLGSYCVIDNKLHDFDDDETVQIMDDIAESIMSHLELMRMKQSRNRSEQLIGGLSAFVASEPVELDQQATSTGSPGIYSLPPIGQRADNGGNKAGSLADGLDFNDSSSHGALAEYSRPSLPQAVTSSSTIETSVSTSSVTGPDSPNETPVTSIGSLGDTASSSNLLEQQTVERDAAETPEENVRSSSPQMSVNSDSAKLHASGFISSANIKSAFFRAANTIRQAMDMDGFMFLDAVPTTFVSQADQLSLDTDRDLALGPFCAEIVQSSGDSAWGAASASSQPRLPEPILQRFIQRFPRGHVFSADEFGPIDESYGIGKRFPGNKSDRDNIRLRNDVATLFRVIPAAKYIIFLPLWHFQRECWYAAALGWVVDPTRAIDAGDVSLVSAFGNSIMAEVSRMEALAASGAKSSFVSSISHELRSPLHGIMASSELLRGSISDPTLLSTLDMLDSCSKTLLDTFNNLLDHAIAIKDGKSPKSPEAKLQLTDLGDLVEEVVEAVHFSHLSEAAFQTSLYLKGVYSAGQSDGTKAAPDLPLLVMLNIASEASWRLLVDTGAWNRIVMNIFGNALKYTRSGRIEVSLKIVKRTDRTGKLCDHICFTVEDTGNGMSADYLKYRLFTPFSQEDTHSPGIGLGLSIIQQLTRGLGGTIDVKSSVGVGTLVEVCLPLKQADSAAQGSTNKRLSPDNSDHLQHHGQTVCFITAEAYMSLLKISPLTVTKEVRKRSRVVERAIRVNAGDVLGMTVITGIVDCPLPLADFYLVDGDVCGQVLENGHTGALMPEVSPLVLLCPRAGSPQCLKQEAMKNHSIHLHHPIGPKKLSWAFSSALDNRHIQVSKSNLTPPVVPPHDPPARSPLAMLLSHQKDVESAKDILLSVEPQAVPKVSAAEATSSLPPRSSSDRHLLLVDDNPINIKLLAAVVHKLRYRFATACHGLEAVQLYTKSLEECCPFDTVFMDISMPIMDGFEAIREIRRLEAEAELTKGCRIVALTGLSSEGSRKEVFASGGNLFLTKPIKLDIVKRLLNDGLDTGT